MHLQTICKVRAANEDEAIERVNDLIGDSGDYYPYPFDWVDKAATKISDDVKTEAEFLKLRELERAKHHWNMQRVAEAKDERIKGFYLRQAGECLEEDEFWSTERLQFTLDETEGEHVFYVETDRHY